MNFIRLGLWLLRRERVHGEWRVLLLALIIGVGSVSTTGFLGDRLTRALGDQSASFLGADMLVTSPRPIVGFPANTLRSSRALEFSSMVARGDAFQLATLRAVDAAYPLRGAVRIADRAFSPGAPRRAQPPSGSVYVDQVLLPLLRAQVGDAVQIGEASFRIAGVVVEEPGQLGGVFGLAPRVFLHADDVPATRILQPGSRLSYLYQFAGEAPQIAAFSAALKPRLDKTQRLVGTRDGAETLRGALANADRYIQLTGLISLLLSVAAIAIAAHRHALRHYDQAALMRCMGATSAQLRVLYGVQLGVLGVLGSAIGVALGALMQYGLAMLLLPENTAHLPALGVTPVWVAIASGLLALTAASLPALIRLIRVSPLRVLRRDLPPLPLAAWVSLLISGTILLALIAWYAQDIQLVALFVGALIALAGVLSLMAQSALLLGRGVQKMAHGPLRFGLAQLLRHRFDSTLQLGAFTLALFLIALLALVRSDLIDRWRQQLPPQAPNHFLVNITPNQTEAVRHFLAQHQLSPSELYPMVRGRLTIKNGLPIESTLSTEQRDNNSLRRELNLTWTNILAANNQIVAGHWHGNRPAAEISVESGMAEKLQLKLGDTLGFTMGEQTIAARISSIRSVKWDSMQPNFFVIFAPGQLDRLPANYIASVYIPPTQTQLLPEFVKTFPTVTVIALDKLIANLEAVFNQIISAIQLLLGFLLAAGLAVVIATLLASLDARQQEAVLLRTLGAQRTYLRQSLSSEFIILGLLSGLLASICAEVAMAVIARRLFELPTQLHPWLWILLPVAGAIVVGVTGGWLTKSITRIPPMQSIRALN
ncbi:MAG: ABC transporter permease [Thiobacillus sp.]